MNVASRRAHFLFALWAAEQKTPPTIAQIMEMTGMHYNSAYQWRTDWLNARSLHATTPTDARASLYANHQQRDRRAAL